MNFKFFIGTKVLFGENCVTENKNEFKKFGKRAFVVTGKNSGKLSGALDDVAGVLENLGIDYYIFDRVENNPSLENVNEAGREARTFKADFIIGIGGGSPLDASKAVSVLAVNHIEPKELYSNVFINKPLPIIAIPTTAGTGSEVTPYSILTRRDLNTKMSFGNEDTFPQIAFEDARYTYDLPSNVTIDTAVDAFCHAMEGYLSRRSTPASDVLAQEAITIFGQCINPLINGQLDPYVREKLMYMAMLGGMVISHTGTTIIHGMGYSLTYFKDLPHGRANGLFIKEYLKFNYREASGKIDRMLELLGIAGIDEFGELLEKMLNYNCTFTEDELKQYASLTMKQKSTTYNIRTAAKQDLFEIMIKSLKAQ
ncbi:MAG: iron-containing alcohol dehydrogenase family protein [Bacillota bacterium]|nr:iron-containing alcohol dehydrogenase family protein [Bacillota bacterium]